MGKEDVVYTLTVEDIQNVATEYLGRKLNKKEVKIVEENLGKTVKWYDAIESAIFISNIKKK
jgi:glutamyl-tRNA reductase